MRGSTSEAALVLEFTFQGHVQKYMPNCVNLRGSINAREEASHNFACLFLLQLLTSFTASTRKL